MDGTTGLGGGAAGLLEVNWNILAKLRYCTLSIKTKSHMRVPTCINLIANFFNIFLTKFSSLS